MYRILFITSLITSELENLSKYLWPFGPFFPLRGDGLFLYIDLLEIFIYIYVLYINYLLDDCIADTFSHAVACLLTLSGVFSFLILMILIKSNLSIVCHDFMYDFKNIEHAS